MQRLGPSVRLAPPNAGTKPWSSSQSGGHCLASAVDSTTLWGGRAAADCSTCASMGRCTTALHFSRENPATQRRSVPTDGAGGIRCALHIHAMKRGGQIEEWPASADDADSASHRSSAGMISVPA